MGRVLKRVPMDFDWPIGKIWDGYLPSKARDKVPAWKDYNPKKGICDECDRIHKDCSESAPYCLYQEDNKKLWFYDPPEGAGYQLWETTSEGSPDSPVFATLDELCAWCEVNATTFADFKATKEEWKQMLGGGFVHHTEGNITFF